MFIPASLCSAWVVGMVRIKWSTSIGLDGRHRSEQVVDIIGIRIHELNRDPTDVELAEAMGVSLSRLRLLMKRTARPISLEAPRIDGEWNDGGLGEITENPNDLAVDEAAARSILHEDLVEALRVLSPEERAVIEHRYGLNGPAGGASLRKVARSLEMTPSKVKRIETSALKKLRRPEIAQCLDDPFL